MTEKKSAQDLIVDEAKRLAAREGIAPEQEHFLTAAVLHHGQMSAQDRRLLQADLEAIEAGTSTEGLCGIYRAEESDYCPGCGFDRRECICDDLETCPNCGRNVFSIDGKCPRCGANLCQADPEGEIVAGDIACDCGHDYRYHEQHTGRCGYPGCRCPFHSHIDPSGWDQATRDCRLHGDCYLCDFVGEKWYSPLSDKSREDAIARLKERHAKDFPNCEAKNTIRVGMTGAMI